jgi:hypothetical protein
MTPGRARRLLGVVLLALGVSGLAGCGGSSTTTVIKKVHERTVTTSATPPTTTTASQQFRTYQGAGYTAQIPSDWTTESDQVNKGSYAESLFQDPANPFTFVKIDTTPGTSLSPKISAVAVRAATSQTPGYAELGFAPTTVAGTGAIKWDFDLGEGVRRVDYFFNECGAGLAVLGSSSRASFDALASLFDSISQSVSCASATPSNPTPPTGTPTTSGTAFCDTHSCIDNFYDGHGYIVQCNDGMWSHSGGLSGACSYHGGES